VITRRVPLFWNSEVNGTSRAGVLGLVDKEFKVIVMASGFGALGKVTVNTPCFDGETVERRIGGVIGVVGKTVGVGKELIGVCGDLGKIKIVTITIITISNAIETAR